MKKSCRDPRIYKKKSFNTSTVKYLVTINLMVDMILIFGKLRDASAARFYRGIITSLNMFDPSPGYCQGQQELSVHCILRESVDNEALTSFRDQRGGIDTINPPTLPYSCPQTPVFG